MMQPEELRKAEPLLWSPGLGTDVWALFCASGAGDLAAVEQLLAKDAALVRASHGGHTALAFAVRENRPEVARLLLRRGADPIHSGTPDTLLQITRDRGFAEMEQLLKGAFSGAAPQGEGIAEAIRGRDLPEVRGLLAASPGLVHALDERTNQPIHWAVMTRQPDMIDELLAHGADIEAQRADGARPIQLANGDYHYRGWLKDHPTTPAEVIVHLRARGAYCDLCTAAHIGDLRHVRELLAGDASLANRLSDYVTYYACSGTPLRNAAAAGHMEIVQMLLEHGADPNLPEGDIAPRGFALYSAVSREHFDVARLLLEHGAHPNVEVDSSADTLSIAIMRSDQRMVDLLCSHGAARPVHLLAHYGDVQTAAAVFAADPALADDPGALGSAAGHEGFVRLMLRYRPDLPERVGVAGATREITELLFRHGMNPSHPDWLGVTPLHRFAERGDVENAAHFIEHGADLDARDEVIRSTPLGYAAKYGRRRMAELLLRHGARPSLPDDPPWATPLAWATRRGHDHIVRLLRAYEENGTLPPLPGLEQYERLADDLVAAYETGDATATERIAAHFEVDARTWNTGRSTLEEVRRRVRNRLEKHAGTQSEDGRLTPADARWLIARWDGYHDWDQMVDQAEG